VSVWGVACAASAAAAMLVVEVVAGPPVCAMAGTAIIADAAQAAVKAVV
jgi:hypothetical protein